jgi:excisionase family DNA binding protein
VTLLSEQDKSTEGTTKTVEEILAQPTATVEEIGTVYGISRATAYEGVASGTIPSLRIGRRILIPCAQVRRQLGIESS